MLITRGIIALSKLSSVWNMSKQWKISYTASAIGSNDNDLKVVDKVIVG